MKRLALFLLCLMMPPIAAVAQFTPQALTTATTGIWMQPGSPHALFTVAPFTSAQLAAIPMPSARRAIAWDSTLAAWVSWNGSAWVPLTSTISESDPLSLHSSGGAMSGNITFTGAQTVDGVDVSTIPSTYATTGALANYLPLAGGTMAGNIQIPLGPGSSQLYWYEDVNTSAGIQATGDNRTDTVLNLSTKESGSAYNLTLTNTGTPATCTATIGGSTIWTAGVDGTGSGLDADTVDGSHASSLLTTETDPVSLHTASIPSPTGKDNWHLSTTGTAGGYFWERPWATGNVLLVVGDSKSNFAQTWFDELCQILNLYNTATWTPNGQGNGGATTAVIDGSLSAAIATMPRGVNVPVILLNCGANDVLSMPAEVDFKASYASILAKLKAAYPAAKVICSRIWRKGYSTESTTLNGWINAVIATNPSGNAITGDNEQVWLDCQSAGCAGPCTTLPCLNTDDGIHYNPAGQTAKATLMVPLVLAQSPQGVGISSGGELRFYDATPAVQDGIVRTSTPTGNTALGADKSGFPAAFYASAFVSASGWGGYGTGHFGNSTQMGRTGTVTFSDNTNYWPAVNYDLVLSNSPNGTLLVQTGAGANAPITAASISCSPTISSGTSAPATTPAKVGDIYVDTSAKKLYFATGTSSSSDWTIAN